MSFVPNRSSFVIKKQGQGQIASTKKKSPQNFVKALLSQVSSIGFGFLHQVWPLQDDPLKGQVKTCFNLFELVTIKGVRPHHHNHVLWPNKIVQLLQILRRTLRKPERRRAFCAVPRARVGHARDLQASKAFLLGACLRSWPLWP